MTHSRITFWTRYSALGASSRLRFLQYMPLLEKKGFDIAAYSFFDDAYLQRLYSGGKRDLSAFPAYCFRRWKQLAEERKSNDPAVIEYELFPMLPYLFEKNFLSGRKYILNFDDAVDLRYSSKPFLKNKYPQLIANASGIITANDLLAEKYGRYNPNVIKIPTVPPVSVSPSQNKPDRFTLVWTGTPVTYKFLYERKEALRLAAAECDFQLLIVGSSALPPLPGVDCRCIDWSEENEAAALKSAHAGIMPLPDTDFARGKSAYKLICYLRTGIPAIASPIGENNKVIQHGRNGFLVSEDQQWADAVKQLSRSGIWQKMCGEAEKSAVLYDLDRTADTLSLFLNKNLFDQDPNS